MKQSSSSTLSTLVYTCWRLLASSASPNLSHTHTTSCPLTPMINQQTHIWKLCSPAMAQPTARHEGDQGGEERTAVSQTPCQAAASAQPRSMPAHLAHRQCGPPEKRRGEDEDTGDPSIGTSERREQRTGVSLPPTSPLLQSTQPGGLRNSQNLKSQILISPPPPHLLPISRLLQQSVHKLTARCRSELAVYPNPKSVTVTTPTDPPGCQILCSAAVLWQRRTVAGWHTGSAAGGFRRTHHHKFLLSVGRRWSSECPLLTAVPCFLMEGTASILPTSSLSFNPRFSLL